VTSLRQRVLDELQRRNYSPATTRGYILAIKQFADYFGKSPERLGGDEIRQFETYLLRDKKLAPVAAAAGIDRARGVVRLVRLRAGERRIGLWYHLLRNDEASGSVL
jgi:hypothetical protein